MGEMPVAVDAFEGITTPFGLHRKRGALRFRRENIGRLTPCRIIVWGSTLGLPNRLSRPCLMDQLGYANAIIGKHPLAPNGLDLMVVRMDPPRGEGAFILPDLVGHQQVLPRQTFEAIDQEPSAHGLKL